MWGTGSRCRAQLSPSLPPLPPAQVLCVVPSSFVQWAAMAGAVGVAVGHLSANIYAPAAAEAGGARARALLPLLAGLHVAFAVIMKVFFFTFSPAA